MTIVCIDGFDYGILRGRICRGEQDAEAFESLMGFLMRMEQILNETGQPQAYTMTRAFTPEARHHPCRAAEAATQRGLLATFELRILFRQHASWQGELVWLERDEKQSFRSVLEVITLLDSALKE